ncbi:hypothetical protein [Aliamphritea hakodatensis]|uniref:hypothetical protein n=1 Tax=Aliamphritea hakodatensis TaxID=2895352 RepID=UPI0022FD4855|nr:hypothetical protein [Aliamphritea hakodatensis]
MQQEALKPKNEALMPKDLVEPTVNNALNATASPVTVTDTVNRRFTVAPMMDRPNQ